MQPYTKQAHSPEIRIVIVHGPAANRRAEKNKRQLHAKNQAQVSIQVSVPNGLLMFLVLDQSFLDIMSIPLGELSGRIVDWARRAVLFFLSVRDLM